MRSRAYLAARSSALRPRPDRLGADQDALGVEAVEQVLEAAALRRRSVRARHRKPVDEDLVGVDRGAAHLGDDAHVDVAASRSV
jgi:hypothetical protein